ncbi:MAG TPA: PSD1 and planctomycete cytochrome C domain-containing protein [Bryobacteraceae bacterium]
MKTRRVFVSLPLVAVLVLSASVIVDAQPADEALGLLKKSCAGCHSGASPAAHLRLDSAEHIAAGAPMGPVIVPGDSAASKLIIRVSSPDKATRMPPMGNGLAPEQIALLRTWVDHGAPGLPKSDTVAKVQKLWSYIKPAEVTPPTVKGPVRNAIDQFILAKLESQGLTFQPEAPKEILIRRLSLDLIGLPPSPKEVSDFVADSRPDAYDRLVNRLLTSPHYGERWARPWLDLARYADTNGYEKDLQRTMWKYRDWVIDALNRDMPYDEFTIEQLAGDLLPNPTIEQKIATGFNRNTMLNEEGGVDKDEAHFEVLVDRVNTTSEVWLGSTLGCSQCHNHKYDPFTQRDYYSMMAFFSHTMKTSKDYGDTSMKWIEPQLDLATPAQEDKRKVLRAKIDDLEAKLKTSTPALESEQGEWEQRTLNAKKDWRPIGDLKAHALHGADLTVSADGSIEASGQNPREETYVIEGKLEGVESLRGIRIEALPAKSLPRGGPGRDVYGDFTVSEIRAEMMSDGKWTPIEWSRELSDDGRVGGKQLWTVDATRDDVRIPRQMVLVAKTPIAVTGPVRITIRQDSEFTGQSIGRFRLSASSVDDPSTIVKVRARFWPILAAPATDRTADQKKDLSAYFRTIAPSLASARDALRGAESDLDRLGIVTAQIMEETPGEGVPCDNIRARGAFASKADKVCADVPEFIMPFPADLPRNRLGLAKWLVSPDNPLTARVAINRIWAQFFGRGIVETAEDFGTQGERPTHPELLDWLAVEFMHRGWSMKAMDRLIVTSNAYRQSSIAPQEVLNADPYNKLISRGARFRLEAELIRDFTLTTSGLMNPKIGGPSVFPYQPDGVWDVPYSNEKWTESKGGDRYRRGLYTFARRSAMYPALINFDATSREVCTVRRIRTNTPLQALTALNDPAFFEAAQAMAKRVEAEGGTSTKDRIDYAFRIVTSRAPTPSELDRMQSWFDKEDSYFKSHSDEAMKIVGASSSGDAASAASWTMLSNVLLNLDEAVTRH